jgi:hypothetical protein
VAVGDLPVSLAVHARHAEVCRFDSLRSRTTKVGDGM